MKWLKGLAWWGNGTMMAVIFIWREVTGRGIRLALLASESIRELMCWNESFPAVWHCLKVEQFGSGVEFLLQNGQMINFQGFCRVDTNIKEGSDEKTFKTVAWILILPWTSELMWFYTSYLTSLGLFSHLWKLEWETLFCCVVRSKLCGT